MKTAVLISGQLRTLRYCLPSQRWHVYRHYPDPHFFLSICDDEQAKDAELLREHYEHVSIERVQDPDLPEIPDALGAWAPYANAAPHKNLLLQHWGNKRVMDFFCEQTEASEGNELQTIIRMRPDNFMHRFTAPPTPDIDSIYTPYWGRFGGVNDRLAVMGRCAAYHYFYTYDKIKMLMDAGCPFHPESLVRASLEDYGIKIKETLQAEFSTRRKDGQRFPEISAGDIADLIISTRT